MPKLKTHRGAAKRFKKTATGKFLRGSAFKRHILTSKTTKRKRARLALSSGADAPLPGSGQSSRFTATLLSVLQSQKGVVPASRIHREVVNALTSGDRVSSAVPTFAPLQSAFHDGVDFLFEHR